MPAGAGLNARVCVDGFVTGRLIAHLPTRSVADGEGSTADCFFNSNAGDYKTLMWIIASGAATAGRSRAAETERGTSAIRAPPWQSRTVRAMSWQLEWRAA
jgi:hypothetical protein